MSSKNNILEVHFLVCMTYNSWAREAVRNKKPGPANRGRRARLKQKQSHQTLYNLGLFKSLLDNKKVMSYGWKSLAHTC